MAVPKKYFPGFQKKYSGSLPVVFQQFTASADQKVSGRVQKLYFGMG
jgi:hypothetical protein